MFLGEWPKINRFSSEARHVTRDTGALHHMASPPLFGLLWANALLNRSIVHLGSNHIHQQVNHTVAVAPLVVVPRPEVRVVINKVCGVQLEMPLERQELLGLSA